MEQLGNVVNDSVIRTTISDQILPDVITNNYCTASKISQQGIYIDINEVSFFVDEVVPHFNSQRHTRFNSDTELFARRMGFTSYESFLSAHLKEKAKLPYVGYWAYFLIKPKQGK